jgi:hypothetical protein
MNILFNDVIQFSNAPAETKSPALSEVGRANITILLDKPRPVNAIGISNTDGSYFNIHFDTANSFNFNFIGNGLYMLPRIVHSNQFIITSNGSYCGRIGAGLGVHIPTTPTKEVGFNSSCNERKTLSGQIIPGSGGYFYRSISLDSRYKITKEIMQEISEGYTYIGMGYPFFIDVTTESYKLLFSKFYGIEKNQQKMAFESGTMRFLYSRRFEFEECF